MKDEGKKERGVKGQLSKTMSWKSASDFQCQGDGSVERKKERLSFPFEKMYKTVFDGKDSVKTVLNTLIYHSFPFFLSSLNAML